jgi:adenosylhomocysteinase
MDMSFANQFLSLARLAREGKSMGKKVYSIDRKQDIEIAGVKLATLDRKIDTLTPAQVAYLTDFASGT